jgi:hypothetical protein
MARESLVTSRHRAEDANANTTRRALYCEGDGFRGSHFFGGGFGGTPGDGYRESRGYGGGDVWGHWGTYYGPMIPAIPWIGVPEAKQHSPARAFRLDMERNFGGDFWC